MRRRGHSGRAVLAAGILALQGCLVLDGRELQVDPPGTVYAFTGFRIRVDGSLDTFTVDIDGSPLDGVFPAHETVYVPLPPDFPEGSHRLVVRAREGAVPRSAERTLVVDRTPVTASVTPAPGRVTSGEPFTIAVTFSRPMVPSSVTPSSARVGSPDQPSLAPPVLSEDARTVSFTLPASLDVLGSVSVSLQVIPAGFPPWQPLGLGFGPWYAPTVEVVVSQPVDGQATNGIITFAATATGELPPSADLMAGNTVALSLGPPPWNVAWDTAAVPEGTYQLSVRSRGYFVTSFSWPRVTVDRTPPTFVRCGPVLSRPDDTMQRDSVIVEFSEPVTDGFPDLLLNGLSRGGTTIPLSGGGYRLDPPTVVIDQSALPATQTVWLPPQQDRAGNLLTNTCPIMTLPPWRRPWGEGPLGTAQGALTASEIALYGPGATTLLAIPPASAASGTVGLWSSSAPSPWTLLRTLDVEPSSSPSGLARGVWVERLGGGPGHVYRIDNEPPGPLNRDPLRDARNPSGTLGGSYGSASVAWSEEVPSGGRAIFAKSRDHYSPTWYDIGGPPLSDPAAVADEPSLARYQVFGAGQLLAWIETAPGGVSQVRAALGPSMWVLPPPTTWTAIPQVANLDPATAAAHPSAWGFATLGSAVAWLEGGKLVARHSAGSWAPQVLNVDPAASARLPRVDGSVFDATVYWVEASAGGDAIWARRWDGVAWRLLPGPLNAGIAGTVQRLDVDDGAVLWADDTGALRLRVANYP